MSETLLKERVDLHCGDCLAVLPTLAGNSVDSCVTDPPYHLLSIVKRFGAENAAPVKQRFAYGGNFKEENGGTGAAFARMSKGFMGKAWDGGDVAFRPETWAEVYRVLKPGAHLLAFGGTRTFARMSVAIEDAGFDVRDTVMWLYGSGFPKSHNLNGDWDGWGTALKPACELIVLARKPLSEKTVAANVLRWGTGAINVDGCRVEGAFESGWSQSGSKAGHNTCMMSGPNYARDPKPDSSNGRWPANIIHDGSEEVVGAFPYTKVGDGVVKRKSGQDQNGNGGSVYGAESRPAGSVCPSYGDEGSAARFFYTAKADADDRIGSKHPTVKPVDLMQYLVRLITPKGGTVLDPFSGTGTTGEAAWREGMKAVLIEREAEYQVDIRRRMAMCLAGPEERQHVSIKARGKTESPGPLFDLPEAAE